MDDSPEDKVIKFSDIPGARIASEDERPTIPQELRILQAAEEQRIIHEVDKLIEAGAITREAYIGVKVLEELYSEYYVILQMIQTNGPDDRDTIKVRNEFERSLLSEAERRGKTIYIGSDSDSSGVLDWSKDPEQEPTSTILLEAAARIAETTTKEILACMKQIELIRDNPKESPDG